MKTLNAKQKEALQYISHNRPKYVLLYGGSRSGKSLLIISIFIHNALVYPNSRWLVCRYAMSTARSTIWQQTILPYLEQLGVKCRVYHSSLQLFFENGSSIFVNGLEPARISKVLGGEYAGILVDEANENSFTVIEKLFTRLNSNAVHYSTGRQITPAIYFTLNPTNKIAWDYKLFVDGVNPSTDKPFAEFSKTYKLQLNPTDNIKNLSTDYLNTLNSLSESGKKRFLVGEYGSSDGLIYPMFSPDKHVIESYQLNDKDKLLTSIDFGYIHPFVCLWGAYDTSNECLTIYRCIYVRRQTVRTIAEIIKQQETRYETIELRIADHDAEDRATLAENGIYTVAANKDVDFGIDCVIDFLERGKLKIVRSCADLINEFYYYRTDENKVTPQSRFAPIKENDDGLDALRYMVLSLNLLPHNGRQKTYKDLFNAKYSKNNR